MSTRMGQPKALLRIGEQTLLRHVIDELKGSRVGDVVVVLGHDAAIIRQGVSLDDVRVVENPEYTAGMSTSIRAGLQVVDGQAEGALIVLADQPFVRSSTINRLLDGYERRKAGIVFPIFKGFRGNPVLVARRLFPALMQVTGDVGCRALFDQHPAEIDRVEVDDPGVLIDLDTPQDFEKAIGLMSRETARPTATGAVHQHKTTGSDDTRANGQQPSTDQILPTAAELVRKGASFALATVVRVEPPTSAKPGAKALILPDGKLVGWVGGICSQKTVVEHGLAALAEGRPRLLSLSSEGDRWETGHGVISVPMVCYSGGAMDIYVEPYLPQPRLLVIGHEPVGAALVRLARAIGIAADIVDPLATKEDFPEAERVLTDLEAPDFAITPQTFVVVATHGRFDEQGLERVAQTDAPYVGLVASRKRAAVILDHLRSRGIPDEKLSKIKTPAGLDIGAETPEEIAVSIIAELVSIRRRGLRIPSDEGPLQTGSKEAVVKTRVPTESGVVDPVCGMIVDPATSVARAEYGARTYFFCCEGCAEKFRSAPAAYL